MSELVMFVGFPASGKSTYYKQHLTSYKIVSKDLMGSNKVKQQARMLEQLLGAGENVVLDNTNLSVDERAQAIPIAKKHGAKIIVLWFTTPFDECMERNSRREGKAKVPNVAMYGMRKRFNEPTIIEGIDEVRQIGVETMSLDKTVDKLDKLEEQVAKLPYSSKPRAGLFLDKDGVLVDDDDYPYIIPKTTLLPGVEEALIKAARLGIPIVVVSNQAWVARGRMTLQEAEGVFEELKQKVAKFGGRIDATYFCPHDTKAKCECRKPQIGMLKRAAKDLNIDLEKSTFIGDMDTDIECGQNAKMVRTVIVKDGEYKKESKPTHTFSNLLSAVNALYNT